MKLFAHQQKLVDEFPQRHALIWETGTGKSLTAIELAKKVGLSASVAIKGRGDPRTLMALANKSGEGTLIICPKALKTKWEEDMKQLWNSEAGYVVFTKEEFKKYWKDMVEYPCVIVDEAHYFFGQKSQMMKSLKGYFKKWNTPYRYFLTATPYRSTPFDIFIMSDLLGKPMSYPKFFEKFFYRVRMGRREIPVVRKGIESDIADIVSRLGSTVKLEDCVDMPPQVFEVEHFSLTKDQEYAMEAVPDLLPIVRFTKFHQICGGTLKGDEYTEPQTFEADKMDRLVELAQTNDKLIVVCRYNHEIDVLSRELKKHKERVLMIHGGIAGENRHKVLQHLKESNNYVLLVNAACSEGWELPGCPLMVFYSLDFSLKNYIQMLGRIQRINNIKRNTYLFLVVKGTIDEEVYKAVKRKEDFHIEIYGEENS